MTNGARIGLSAAVLFLTALVAFLVALAVSNQPSGASIGRVNSSPTIPMPCAVQPQTLLASTDLIGFRTQVNGAMGLPPISTRPGVPSSDLPAAYRTFVTGKLVGYVIEKAYQEPYLGLSQAHQRKLGYPVTETPELPLQGQIVDDTPGILEAYQLNTVYSSQEGAANFQLNQTYGYTDPLDTRVTLTAPLSAAVAYFIRPPVPGFEWRYQIDLVLGVVQVDFQFRGGSAMPIDTVTQLAGHAVQRLMAACHLPQAAS